MAKVSLQDLQKMVAEDRGKASVMIFSNWPEHKRKQLIEGLGTMTASAGVKADVVERMQSDLRSALARITEHADEIVKAADVAISVFEESRRLIRKAETASSGFKLN